ncbi:MAG: sigma-70 family RNA polymerase sigma factor [Oscillospiraceae bacterium]|nr:sigma-70 family RNA polymerase sigma factor [Oscillospiraceae bacterium]
MDETLIRQAAAGDQNAFAALLAAYQKPVYNLALRMTGSPDDALDLSQEAFLRAWRGLSGYRFDASFSTWLYRLTGNVCIDFLRRRKKEKTIPLYYTDEENEEQELPLPHPAPAAEDQALLRLEQSQVAEAMAKLEPEYRQALILRVIDGLSYAEIAAATDVPEGTVKSRIARAREKMRRLLKKTGNKSPAPSSKRKKGGPG